MDKKDDVCLMNIGEVCQYIRMGKNVARRIMDEIGATIKIGDKKVFFDKAVIDEYLESQRQGKTEE